MDWDDIKPLLTARLSPNVVKPAKPFGPKGDYIEGWHAIAEANRIFGFGAWSYEVRSVSVAAERPREIGKEKKDGWGVTYIAHVIVTVSGTRREDYGAGHGYDVDLGLAHESAVKEAVTDALKRALRTFGNPFGLALYDKERSNVGYEPDAEAIAHALSAINAAETTSALAAIWGDLPGDIKRVAAVESAKNTAKTRFAGAP